MQKNYLSHAVISTLYFGGGTPSLLEENELYEIIDELKNNFIFSDTAEVTLEANPDDISPQKIIAFNKAGINRLSIGIQSFDEADLRFMNRAHSAAQATDCVQIARDNGISSMSLDLIYGIPDQAEHTWRKNLELLAGFSPEHFSAYALTAEPKTHFNHLIKTKKIKPVTDKIFAERFYSLMDFARENNYDHYEISNFGKTGKYARHNTAYWQGIPYLGLGPSAHSYNGKCRRWNKNNNIYYIKSIEEGTDFFEEETLTTKDIFNEYILTRLRTYMGVDTRHIRNNFPKKYYDEIFKKAEIFAAKKLIFFENEILHLTPEGKLLADGISAELFWDEE